MTQLPLELEPLRYEPDWLELLFYSDPMACTDELMADVLEAIINQRYKEESQ